MEQDFYRDRLVEKFSVDVITPEQNDRDLVHRVIYKELCLGITNPASVQANVDIIDRLRMAGPAVILGCTEITVLINSTKSSLPVYDTTELHAHAAVGKALPDTN
jgi:aspartate racemase